MKYIVLCPNTAHPTKDLDFFLLEDSEDNTLVFESREKALEAAKSMNPVFACSLIPVDDIEYL